MPADQKAFTIVTTFLGMVMFGFWIAHACAVAHQSGQPAAPQYRIEAFAA